MKNKLSTRDWQALSAYLDGQLAPKQRHRLEARLIKEGGLQDALDGLRHTRAILRSQPKLRAPRNFALTPQMAGVSARQPSQPAYPLLRLASVLATIFFVVIFAGDLYLNNFGPEPMIMSQNAPVQKSAPWFGVGGAGGGSDSEEAFALPVEEPAAIESAASLEKEGELIEPSLADATVSGPQETPLPERLETEMVLAPTPEQAIATTQPAAYSGWSVLRILQVALAVLAVVTGLAALFMRRSLRR